MAETYQYNKANWITALTNSKDGQTLSSYAYTYYASGSQKSETDHNNVVTSYTYDDLGRLTQESETGELAVSYAYDANGNRIRMTVGNPPVIITLDPNGGTLPEGAATQITLPVEDGYTLPTPTFPFMTFTGWYLDDTEVTDENLSQITASCTLTAQWDDELGGIIIGPIDPIFPPTPPPEIMSETPEEEDDEGENTTSYTVAYTYDANNRLVAEVSDKTGENVLVSYTYDDNGNLLSQLNVDNTAVVTHSYDGFNRLISSVTGAGTITYTYNAQGIRTSRTVGVTTTNYLLDGGNVIGEVTGTTTTTYLRGVNLISSNGTYYLHNAHGDVVQLTDSTGAVTKTYSYDAFGNEHNPDEEDANPFRYCGEYYDTETGLYYFRARYYDPLIGRFISEDPIKDGSNWYSYVYGNPILYRDPLGLSGILSDGTYYITHPLDEQLLRLKEEYETATEERRAEIAREAQAIRDGGAEGVDWSVDAKFSIKYYYIDTDVTERLHQIMIDAATEYGHMREYNSVIGEVIRYTTFYNLVKPGGVYDLKAHPEWKGRAHFIYCGEVIWFDDPGNMLYGFLGSAMGFSQTMLCFAGGLVQIAKRRSSWAFWQTYFDDPRDQAAIRRGIELYRKNPMPAMTSSKWGWIL